MTPDLLKNIVVVGAGSCIGGIFRYLISVLMNGKGFPWGTLAVNLLGCLFIGVLWGWFTKAGTAAGNLALFLTVGFCGGFTTFSTFSKEALAMLQHGNFWWFSAYVAISVVVGILVVAAGYWIAGGGSYLSPLK